MMTLEAAVMAAPKPKPISDSAVSHSQVSP